MYPFIVCFCGRDLGSIYDLFTAMRADKYRDAYGDLDYDMDPVVFCISDSLEVDLSEIFESLHLHMQCCRTHINTQVEFKDVY